MTKLPLTAEETGENRRGSGATISLLNEGTRGRDRAEASSSPASLALVLEERATFPKGDSDITTIHIK